MRWYLWLPIVLLLGYGAAVAAGLQPAVPFDVTLNVLGDVERPELAAAKDGKRRLVVLQHGLWRSPWSLWRLERALRAHGYEVLNPGYPSTRAKVAAHAERLRDAIEGHVAFAGAPDELLFVGHSMGGLVIEEYLRKPDARPPTACVYLAVPHRGAMLCDLRKHWWLFQLLMGDQAALQISPGDPLHQRPILHRERSGAIVGDRGAANSAIPGNDDGTVAVAEAALEGAADAIVLPLGHTAIAADRAAIEQVLQFCKHRRFAR